MGDKSGGKTELGLEPYERALSLHGSTAVVTGAAAGIGAAIAERLAEGGADLLLVDRDAQRLSHTAAALRSRYPRSVTEHVVDLTDLGAIEAFWAGVSLAPDILVNNAGMYRQDDLLTLEADDYEQVMRLNLRAAVFMCRDLIGRRRSSGGAIVNVASIEARAAFTKDMALYGVSKAALPALTRAITRDYAKYGWRANTVLPGAIKTPGTAAMKAAAIRQVDIGLMKTYSHFSARLGTGSWGRPDDVARVVRFLVSPAASYVNGAEIPVDGGFLAL